MMKAFQRDVLAAVFFLALSGYVFYQTYTQFTLAQAVGGGPFANSAFYPRIIAGAMAILALILLVKNLIALGRRAPSPEAGKPAASITHRPERFVAVRLLSVAGLLLLYTILLPLIGYLVATPLAMAGLFLLLGLKRPLTVIVLAVASTLVLYLLFGEALQVILPRGRLLPG